jgi:hypothetical protein
MQLRSSLFLPLSIIAKLSIIAMKIYGCLNLIVVMFYLWQSSYVILMDTPSDKLPYLQNR